MINQLNIFGQSINQESYQKYYSLDIFDTILTRKVGSPKEVFRICGEKALSQDLVNVDPYCYQSIRIDAENRARKIYEEDINLPEIYYEIQHALFLSFNSIEKLMQIEIETENELIVSVPFKQSFVKNIRLEVPNIIYISDMYLPEQFILDQLIKYGFWEEGDKLYLSGQLRKTKANGTLFDFIINDLQITPKQLNHIGNNYYSDIEMANHKGIDAKFIEDANLNRFENIMEMYAPETNGVSSYLSGASRLTRLSINTESEHDSCIRDISAAVGSPIIVSYVIWILQIAKSKKIDVLYFFSRDGEILLKVAQILSSKIYPEIELRYLYVSRQSVRIPSINTFDGEALDWIFENTDILTISSILNRVNLKIEDYKQYFYNLGYKNSDLFRNLDSSERLRLRSIFNSKDLRDAILKVNIKHRKILLDYLKQEGLLSNRNYAIVDLGWKGSIQIALENILTKENSSLPTGFYFGLNENGSYNIKGETECFFYDLTKKLGISNLGYNPTPIMELFCSGNEGMSIGYMHQNNKVVQILKNSINNEVLEWGLKTLQTTVLYYTNLICKQNLLSFETTLLRNMINELLKEFLINPTRTEANVFGSFPYFDDPNEDYYYEWGKPLKITDVFNYFINTNSCLMVHRASWPSASYLRSSFFIRIFAKAAFYFRYLTYK